MKTNYAPTAEGMIVEEITMEEWLSELAGSLSAIGLVPLAYEDRPAEPVTLTEVQNNGR